MPAGSAVTHATLILGTRRAEAATLSAERRYVLKQPRSQSESRMREIRTSGLMSGGGNGSGERYRASPRHYNLSVESSSVSPVQNGRNEVDHDGEGGTVQRGW